MQFHRHSKSYHHYQSLKYGTKDNNTHFYREGNRLTFISNTQCNSLVIYHPRWLQTVMLDPSNLHWPSATQSLAAWSTLQHQTEPTVKIQMEKQVTDLCKFTMKLNSRVLVPGIKIKQQNQFCKNFILSLKLWGSDHLQNIPSITSQT